VSEKQYRDKIAGIRADEARVEADLAKARRAAAKYRSDASSSRRKITAKTSASTARLHESSAATSDRRAESEDAKVTNLTKKLATLAKARADAEDALEREVEASTARRHREDAAAAQKRRQEDERRRRAEAADAQRRRREDDQRRAAEITHAQMIGGLSMPRIVQVPVARTEKMRVLIMTANPVDPGASPAISTLWIDREIRDAQRAVERAKHRDRLDIVIRPAAQRDDLLDQLNLHTPHVLHFSGHGSDAGIYFETDDRERDELLTGELLARAVTALDNPPRVVILNACDTEIIGDLLADHGVEAVISMNQPISDTAARIFAEQLYSAIANGQSLQNCFDQAVVKLAFANLGEEDIPVLTCATDVDASKLILVSP
jgi:hypothetical protein